MPDQTPATDKAAGGRPSKLTEEFMVAMMLVINADNNALIYTDEELIFQVNERLPLEARICGDTFRRWKAGEISDDARAQAFFGVYKKALMHQKSILFKRLDDERNPSWQKEAWKIERKFSDWNIKQQITINKPEDPVSALAAALLGGDTSGNAAASPGPQPTGTNPAPNA